MKIYASNTCVALALALAFACSPSTEKAESAQLTASKLEKKSKPTDALMVKWAWPDPRPDFKAFNKAAEKAGSAQQKASNGSWTLEGPTNIGGRINTLAVHPGNEDIVYAGSCTGGVFKTNDGGETWSAISDDFDYLPIAHIVFHPEDPETVLVATGDPNISGFPHPGNGVYRSTDGGVSWENIGLENMGVVSKVVYDPLNPSTIYVAAMGIPFERTDDRGLYKSTDNGTSWEQVLFLGDEAGITDLKVNPENPNVIYAAGWRRIRNNQESLITGDESRIYKSNDGGETWETLMNGLPDEPLCRIGLEMSVNDPDRLWAIIIGSNFETHGIYRSDDAGESWVNLLPNTELLDGALGGFGWYFAKFRVNPADENELSVLGVDLWTSFDNGVSWDRSTPIWWMYEVHADKHDMVYLDESTVMLATDGGIYRTDNHFATWSVYDDIPNTQFYRIALNPHNPGMYTGGAQDNGTSTGNIDLLDLWVRDYGGDGFQCIYHPEMENLRYMETQNGNIVAEYDFDVFGMTDGISSEDRRNWDMPYVMSPQNPNTLYTGTYRVYRIDDAPFSAWYPISEDLTQGIVFGANFHTISSVAADELDEDLLYAGTSDGRVWRGEAQGFNYTWSEITEGLPNRYVTNIKTSSETPGRIWVTHSGYRDNDQTARIHRSDDFGANWVDVTGDLPAHAVNHLESVNDSILFIATDFGVYHTLNSGDTWVRVGDNMPQIPVFDIEIEESTRKLIAGTFARGMWSFDTDLLFEWPTDVGVAGILPVGSKLYPNPCRESINLCASAGAEVQVFDLTGRMQLQSTLRADCDALSLGHLKSGKYVMLIRQGASFFTESFIKE